MSLLNQKFIICKLETVKVHTFMTPFHHSHLLTLNIIIVQKLTSMEIFACLSIGHLCPH